MSIPNLIYKIKSKTGIDKITLMYLLIIVGVGIASFGLGRISLNSNLNENNDIAMIKTPKERVLPMGQAENSGISRTQPMEKRYVASKNGKMYYSLGCSGAKRIKPENEIWFSSSEDAEKSGYSLSSTCK